MSTKLSVDDFKEHLRAEIKQIAQAAGKDESKEADRGYAFQLWFARLAAAYENYDVDPEDAVLIGSRDLKADVVLEDETRKHLLVCQCKYESMSKKSTVDETPVVDFFNRHLQYCNRDWVRKHGSEGARELLLDYGDKIEDGYKATFYFVTTAAAASPRVGEAVARVNADFAARQVPVTCQLIDFAGLKDYYVRAQTKDQSPPERVEIRLMRDRFFEKSAPYNTLVATLKGSTLRDLYKQHKETLFNFNIRGYLGSRGINDQIREAAESQSGEFFYFNNGVSAICTNYSIHDCLVVAHGFQIINGAQTVGTIARAKFGDDLEVLFRLTQSSSVKSEKGFNSQIIQSNNTQNAIRVSDFRANDPIQNWLQQQLANRSGRGALPAVHYVAKRSSKRMPAGTVGLRLEELAKLRYAFEHEPTRPHADPRALWTPKEEGGFYEYAFGDGEHVGSTWSEEALSRALLAIALMIRIEKDLKKLGPEMKHMKRLRYHVLALCGIVVAQGGADLSELVTERSKFEELWDQWSETLFAMVSDPYEERVKSGDMAMFAFVRSTDQWELMKRKLEGRLKLKAAKRAQERSRK